MNNQIKSTAEIIRERQIARVTKVLLYALGILNVFGFIFLLNCLGS